MDFNFYSSNCLRTNAQEVDKLKKKSMKKNIFNLLLLLAILTIHSFAAEASIHSASTSNITASTPEKPSGVPDEVWAQFLASIDNVEEFCSWSAEVALLEPYLDVPQVLLLVESFFPGEALETFMGWKNRRTQEGCVKNTRYICVIRDCDNSVN